MLSRAESDLLQPSATEADLGVELSANRDKVVKSAAANSFEGKGEVYGYVYKTFTNE